MTDLVQDIVSDKQPTPEELEDFKNKVNEWCKVDDQIKRLMIGIRERKKMQQALDVYIKDFMFTYNFHHVNVNNSKISARKKEYLSPITVNDVKRNIIENNNLSGEELINFIFDPERREKKKKKLLKELFHVLLILVCNFFYFVFI